MSEDNGNPKLSYIKPVNREIHSKKLRALQCFESFHQKVLDGWTPLMLAQFIQKDSNELTDIAEASLVTMINRYREGLPPGTVVAQRMPEVFKKAETKLLKSVDEVEELEWLVKFQKRRLKGDGELEKKMGKLLPTMTQEVRAHVEVLRTLASVKMDLGVNKRHLGTLEVDASLVADVVGKYGSVGVGKVLQDSGSRQRVLSVAERFMALANKEIDGTDDEYVEVDESEDKQTSSSEPASEAVVDSGTVPSEEGK